MSALFGLFGALCPTLLAILRFTFRRVEFATNICHVHMRRWQLQAHLTHRVGNDLRYGKIPEPLVIGWNDVPRRVVQILQQTGELCEEAVCFLFVREWVVSLNKPAHQCKSLL